MILKDLLGNLNHDLHEGARHVVIANQTTGKRYEIDYVQVDADGVLNIVTSGDESGDIAADIEASDPEDGDE